MYPQAALLKIDIQNAFGCIDRHAMTQFIRKHLPPITWQKYGPALQMYLHNWHDDHDDHDGWEWYSKDWSEGSWGSDPAATASAAANAGAFLACCKTNPRARALQNTR